MSFALQKILLTRAYASARAFASGDLGSGAGRGGGGGGSIREAGGAFGIMEAAREGQYFHMKQKEQLLRLKKNLSDTVEFHREQIKRYEDAIIRSKQNMADSEKHD